MSLEIRKEVGEMKLHTWIHQQIDVEVKVVDKITQGEHVDREEEVAEDRTLGNFSELHCNVLDGLVRAQHQDKLRL